MFIREDPWLTNQAAQHEPPPNLPKRSLTPFLFLHLFDIDSLHGFRPLWTSSWSDAEIHLGDDESVVRPAVSPTHGIGHSDILPVLFPDNDIVN